MTKLEQESLEMARTYWAAGGFSKSATVRVKNSACGYSVKIGTKAFSNHLPELWFCISDVDKLEKFGYNVEQARKDIEILSF